VKNKRVLPLLVTGLIVFGAASLQAQENVDTAAVQSYNLGIQAEQNGDTAEALTYYQAAVTADPNYADAHHNIAAINFAQRNYEKAAENFKKLTEIDPTDPEGFASYGKVLYVQDKYDEAMDAYQQALQISPNYGEALKELGKINFKMATRSSKAAERKEFYQQCIGNLEKYVGSVPDDAYSYYLMGMAHKRLKNYNKAIENLTMAVELDPEDFESMSSLAGIYVSLERYSKAIDAYEKALKLKPKDYLAAYNLAIAVQSSNPENYDAAIGAWQRFLGVARKNTDSRAKKLIDQAESLIEKLEEAKAAGG